MTEYDKTFENVQVLFENDNLDNTLGEVLEKNGCTQIRIAETEKYPHVSFFFSGGREKPFEGERRILIPSPKVATYDLQPEMNAAALTTAIVNEIENNPPDFICLNYANADMVGHTGIWEAAIKAAETVDQCVAQVVKAGLEKDYTIFRFYNVIGTSGFESRNPDGLMSQLIKAKETGQFTIYGTDYNQYHEVAALGGGMTRTGPRPTFQQNFVRMSFFLYSLSRFSRILERNLYKSSAFEFN
jgi:hypothetical protein